MRMLYAHVITAFESYLADTMKRQILVRQPLLRRFVETHPEMATQSIKKSDLFAAYDVIEHEVVTILDKTSFHNLAHAMNMYKSVLQVSFPKNLLPSLGKAVSVRHDIVHRNGKSTSGMPHVVGSTNVSELIEVVEQVVEIIDAQVIDGLLDLQDVRDVAIKVEMGVD